MDELFRLGLNNAAWAAGLAVVAAVGSRIWRDRPALAHALWLLVLLKLATPSVMTIGWSWSGRAVPGSQVVERPSAAAKPAASASTAVLPLPHSAQRFARDRNASLASSNAEQSNTHFADRFRSNVGCWPWRTAIALLWLSGAGVLVGLGCLLSRTIPAVARFGHIRARRSARPR